MSTASSISALLRPTSSAERARRSTSARPPGFTRAWSSRTGTRTVPPIRVVPSKARDASSSAPARTSPTTRRRGRRVRRARSRGTRGPTTTCRSARACGSSAGGSATRGIERSCSPTTTRSSTVRSPTSPASAGSARTPTSCSPAPAAGSCSVASSPPPSTRWPRHWPTGAGRAGAASTAARPARSWRPGVVDANRCLAWLVQQPGTFPRRVPRDARRPVLRVRRLPDGLPALRAARPPSHRRPRRRRPGVGRCARCARGVGRVADRALRAVVPRRPRSALVAAQRADRARQHR